jgi:hypothetical protein
VTWQDRAYAQRWTYDAKTTRVLGEFYWPCGWTTACGRRLRHP